MKQYNCTSIYKKSVFFFWFLTVLSFSAPFPAFAQKTDEPKEVPAQIETTESRIVVVKQKSHAISGKISAAKSMENLQSANRFNASLDEIKQRTTFLQETETIYQRQLSALIKQESLKKELALLVKKSKLGTGKTIVQKPPYSLNVYDYYYDQFSNSSRQVDVAAQSISVDKQLQRKVNEKLKDAEKNLRAVAETNIYDKDSLEWQKLIADDKVEFAQSLVDLQQIIASNNLLDLKLAELEKTIDQQNIDWLKEKLTFNEEELVSHLTAIEEKSQKLKLRIDKLLREQHLAENKWVGALEKNDLNQAPNDKKMAIDNAYLQAREAWRETYQQIISHNNSMLQALNKEANLWRRRYSLLKKEPPVADLKLWRKEAKDEIVEFSQAMLLQQTHQNNVLAKISSMRIQLNNDNIHPEVRQHLNTNLQALVKLGERNFEYLTTLQGTIELNQRLVASINVHLKEFSLGDQIEMIRASMNSIWRYELFFVDTQGVTVGKIFFALIILIAGTIFSGFFTRLIHRRLLVRLSLSESTTAITEKLIYYTSFLVVILITLRLVNIPITAFTFLGGAVAIGVGFGAQKLINNFISGFILMIEQPIKVGDIVQLDSSLGKIEDIGVRSTRVLTFDNVHLLVPNSYFLENNITNWTHNDNIVRGRVSVGVIYGSSTKNVKKQLLKAVNEHGDVLKKPEPYVLFDDFGDNSLVFTLFFWIIVERVIDKKRIESDIRFMIDKCFREENLVIAFPQRDVHLDTSMPLQIVIKKDAEEESQDAK